MLQSAYLSGLIASRRLVNIRLLEGRDIQAALLSQDADSVIVQRPGTTERSMIFKRAISVITPATEGQETKNEHDTGDENRAGHQR